MFQLSVLLVLTLLSSTAPGGVRLIDLARINLGDLSGQARPITRQL